MGSTLMLYRKLPLRKASKKGRDLLQAFVELQKTDEDLWQSLGPEESVARTWEAVERPARRAGRWHNL